MDDFDKLLVSTNSSEKTLIAKGTTRRIVSSDDDDMDEVVGEEHSMPLASVSRIKSKAKARVSIIRDDSDVDEDEDEDADANITRLISNVIVSGSEDEGAEDRSNLEKSKVKRRAAFINDDTGSEADDSPSLNGFLSIDVEKKKNKKKIKKKKTKKKKTKDCEKEECNEECEAETETETEKENDLPENRDVGPSGNVRENLKALVSRRRSKKNSGHKNGHGEEESLGGVRVVDAIIINDASANVVGEQRENREEEKSAPTERDEGKILGVDDDLFDAEGSSDDGVDNRSRSTEDEEDERDLLEIKKKAKAKFTSTTKEPSSRPKRENVKALHRESQRLNRDSRIRLPRHVPTKKALEMFCGRGGIVVPNTPKDLHSDTESLIKNLPIETKGEDKENVDLSRLTSLMLNSAAEDSSGRVSPIGSPSPSNLDDHLPDIDVSLTNDIPHLRTDCAHEDQVETCRADSTVVKDFVDLDSTKMGSCGDIHQGAKNAVNKFKEKMSLVDPSFISRTPRLTGTVQQIISLDNDDEDDVEDGEFKNGVDILIDRFVQHTAFNKPRKPAQNEQVTLNILRKETDDEGHNHFKTEPITINLKPVKTIANYTESTPGYALKVLKDELEKKLKVNREECRQRRIILYNTDKGNESSACDSDEDNDEDVEEEEEILSDLATDEESESESEDGRVLEMKPKKKRSVFVEDEAEEEDGDGDGDGDDEAEEDDLLEGDEQYLFDVIKENKDVTLPSPLSSVTSSDTIDNAAKGNPPPIRLDRCETIELFPQSMAEIPESKREACCFDGSMNDSSDFAGSMIPAHQPGGGLTRNDESEDIVSQYETRRFGVSQFTGGIYSQPTQGQSPSSICRRVGLGLVNDSTQNNINELFDLCSGKWAEDEFQDLGVAPLRQMARQCSEENEAEFFDRHSGQVDNPDPFAAESMTQKEFHTTCMTSSDLPKENSSLSADERSVDSHISLAVGNGRKRKVRRVLSDSDDADDSNPTENINSECEEVAIESEGNDINSNVLHTIRPAAKDFFEDEAELSGSEASSDEDEEIAVEDDILEEELGDDEYLSEEELREQVEKVHHKLLMDDDQKELRIYKELYLEDGDLHSNDQARLRKFRWRNIDDSAFDDDGGANWKDSDEERANDIDDGLDIHLRAQRHERQKWMAEHTANKRADEDDPLLNFADSQLGQLANRITIICKRDSLSLDTPPTSQSPRKSKKTVQRGSFLNARGKDYLAKLVGQTKSANTIGNGENNLSVKGPNNSRNFVFARVSPTPPPLPAAENEKPAQLRRVATTPASSLTVSKRARFDRRSASINPDECSHNSIFNLL